MGHSIIKVPEPTRDLIQQSFMKLDSSEGSHLAKYVKAISASHVNKCNKTLDFLSNFFAITPVSEKEYCYSTLQLDMKEIPEIRQNIHYYVSKVPPESSKMNIIMNFSKADEEKKEKNRLQKNKPWGFFKGFRTILIPSQSTVYVLS